MNREPAYNDQPTSPKELPAICSLSDLSDVLLAQTQDACKRLSAILEKIRGPVPEQVHTEQKGASYSSVKTDLRSACEFGEQIHIKLTDLENIIGMNRYGAETVKRA